MTTAYNGYTEYNSYYPQDSGGYIGDVPPHNNNGYGMNNGYTQQSQNNYDDAVYTGGIINPSVFPHLDDNDNVEVWTYGEGQYDYLMNNPSYGYHGGSSVDASSVFSRIMNNSLFYYGVIDNLKYIILLTVFYIVSSNAIHAHSHSVGEMEGNMESLGAFIFAVFVLLFWKTVWRMMKHHYKK